MNVEILKTDTRLGIRKGHHYKAEVYGGDPVKITLIQRITKSTSKLVGKKYKCNQYRSEVKILN